ncbi:hypothetical protein [Streptomyces sp. NBC_00151]|uniref:hypothetical protein n=1 Tax=Streptomyces sp. NBC_00151 TaxID=2975669 RepID=UPI002DDA16F3|nr:hypothetical protein [Streptomyces sp. NBC_00151]WRZ39937.1 hypothetical protein OG915_18950 [Streptomyces sp. NBC_00151]
MGNGANAQLGKPSVKGGAKASAAAERISKREAELRRRRALLDADFARDAERRRNGLGAAPVRAEKPASPAAPGKRGRPGKRAKKRSTRGLSAAPAVRAAPVVDRGVDRRQQLPKIAPAYMVLTAADLQRERRREQARKKQWEERVQAKRKARATEKSGTAGTVPRRAKTSGTGAQATKPRTA